MGILRKLLGWAMRDAAPSAAAPSPARQADSFWSTHAAERFSRRPIGDYLARLRRELPRFEGGLSAADSVDGQGGQFMPKLYLNGDNSISEVLAAWFASQGFIGHQLCAILAQHWMIDKACTMPGRDAIRHGFEVVNVDGDDLDPKSQQLLARYDREMRLKWNLEQFVRMGRIFGIRIALFKVESVDKDYYENPFNPDGVTPGSYKGIVQVDPYWTAPILDQAAATNPDTMHFYEPTHWLINGKRYHRSHLVIFRNGDPPDILKPQYLYGGVPIPQRIMERVYGAERTANEAPQLVQTKRATVWRTDMKAFVAGGDKTAQRLADWANFRDNYAIKVGDKEGDEFQQFDTGLADLDTVIMTQYQIVAAAANVPSTKLMGTSPKGFNATGEFEEKSYHEELESIQAHDLTPLVERHHLLVARSFIPALKAVTTSVEWRPVDSPTAKQLADTNLVKAQTGAALIQSGALSSEDERARLALDPSSGYAGVDLSAPVPVDDDLDDDDGEEPGAR